jgi:hypothetical protein
LRRAFGGRFGRTMLMTCSSCARVTTVWQAGGFAVAGARPDAAGHSPLMTITGAVAGMGLAAGVGVAGAAGGGACGPVPSGSRGEVGGDTAVLGAAGGLAGCSPGGPCCGCGWADADGLGGAVCAPVSSEERQRMTSKLRIMIAWGSRLDMLLMLAQGRSSSGASGPSAAGFERT